MNNLFRVRSRFSGFAAAALIIAAALTGCAGLPPGMQAPSVTIADLSVGNAGLFEQQLNIRLRIQNPNAEEFKVDGVAFDLEVNDQPFAKGVGNQLVTVPRYGSAIMQVEAVSTLGGLVRQLGRLAQGEKPLFKYHIRGSMSVAAGPRLPFDERGEFDLTALRPRL